MDDWTFTRVGDASLVATCGHRIDPDLNDRVVRVATALRRRPLAGVHDVVESYCGVTIHFDPPRTDLAGLWRAVEEAARAHGGRNAVSSRDGEAAAPVRTVPVCYGGRLGPDLTAVARHAGLTEEEVVRCHAGQTYRVYMLGFLPGFAYLGSVPEEIATPRRQSPRLRVPAGAVGIAGRQTGIYPVTAPGGWQLIGRTALRVFDLEREDPFLLRVGDRVRFEAVPEKDLATLATHGGQGRS